MSPEGCVLIVMMMVMLTIKKVMNCFPSFSHIEKITTWQDPRKAMNQPLNHLSLHPAVTSTPAPPRSMAVSQPNLGKPRVQLRGCGARGSFGVPIPLTYPAGVFLTPGCLALLPPFLLFLTSLVHDVTTLGFLCDSGTLSGGLNHLGRLPVCIYTAASRARTLCESGFRRLCTSGSR